MKLLERSFQLCRDNRVSLAGLALGLPQVFQIDPDAIHSRPIAHGRQRRVIGNQREAEVFAEIEQSALSIGYRMSGISAMPGVSRQLSGCL